MSIFCAKLSTFCHFVHFLILIIEIIHHGYGYGDVEGEDEGDTVAEFGMLGFVMPDFHAEQGSEAAS